MAELADAPDLESGAERLAGSTPVIRTIEVKTCTLARLLQIKFIVFDIMGFFHCLKELMNIYENDPETLGFPCEFKKKLKMKASLGNLSISFTSGHLIKINNTNLSVT